MTYKLLHTHVRQIISRTTILSTPQANRIQMPHAMFTKMKSHGTIFLTAVVHTATNS